MTELQNSTFLDSFGNQQATADQFAALASNDPASVISTLSALYSPPNPKPDEVVQVTPGYQGSVTVALVLNRNTDAGLYDLINGSWADRQSKLQDQTAIWDKYGANPATYQSTATAVDAIVAPTSGQTPAELASAAGYVSTTQDRTIWLTLNESQFQDLFGTDLYTVQVGKDKSFPAWGGNLSLPDSIAGSVGGVWVEEKSSINNPAVQYSTEDPNGTYPGIGNAAPADPRLQATPSVVAANYNFPTIDSPTTPDIALIEESLPDSRINAVLEAYNAYRDQALGLTTPLTKAEFDVVPSPAGAAMSGEGWKNPELDLDLSIIAGTAPNSSLKIYRYQTNPDNTGDTTDLLGTPFNAYQQAFFDPNGVAPVLSSSASLASQPTKDSPFQWAWQQLFVDGMLSDVSVHLSAGDQGSSGDIPNGTSNVPNSQSSPLALVVGGTSIADRYTARYDDPTLKDIAEEVGDASTMDLSVLWTLVAAGLTIFPTKLPDVAPNDPLKLSDVLQKLVETVWQHNTAVADDSGVIKTDFGDNVSTVGGIANGVPIPSYQADFGLDSVTDGQRGAPDVSALAGGDYWYDVLNPDYDNSDPTKHPLTKGDGGTSAAAPLWAGLTAQFDAAFQDQGLPNLGFYNDLLYTAAVIAPASFNDIQLGSNTNSFYLTGTDDKTDYRNSAWGDEYMIPTGQGNSAAPGYDLVSGLGTPNGLILGRTLEAIAHIQTSFSDVPQVLAGSAGNWTSAVDQSLLFQPMFSVSNPAASKGGVDITIGGDTTHYRSPDSDDFAVDSRFAGQMMQDDFDSDLVASFDNQAQARPLQFQVSQGDGIDVALSHVDGQALQEALSNSYGFVDFFTGDGNLVRVARPLAIAETASDDRHTPQTAIVRLSQGGEDDYSLMLYKVDDLMGSIDGLMPGEHGYTKAARARAYELSGPDTSPTSGKAPSTVSGPGYGNFSDSTTFQVNPGDYVAMMFTDNTTHKTLSSFTTPNDATNSQGRANLWNYGLNMWGWEDFSPGTTRDYNDLMVQIDFTSAYSQSGGKGLLS